MILSNTKLNTTIPGMEGYKKVESFDKMNAAKQMYDEFSWILKG